MSQEEGISLSFNDDGEAKVKQTGPYEPTCLGHKTDCEYFDYIKHTDTYYETFCHEAQQSPFRLNACPHGYWWKEGHAPAPPMKVIPATDSR